jgi:hypothetical protein
MCGKSKTDIYCDDCGRNRKQDSTIMLRTCGHMLCDVCNYNDACYNDEPFEDWADIDETDEFFEEI